MINFKLVVLDESAAGAEIPIQDPRCLIGRGNECEVIINDELVSRQHCALTITDNCVRLRDLDSTNGSYHNGVRISEPTLLADGDLIRFGNVQFRCSIEFPTRTPATTTETIYSRWRVLFQSKQLLLLTLILTLSTAGIIWHVGWLYTQHIRIRAAEASLFTALRVLFVISALILVIGLSFLLYLASNSTRTVVELKNRTNLLEVEIEDRKWTQAEFVKAKEEAEAANLAKSRFLANISHELRTPLNSVIGFANILLKNKGNNLLAKDLTYLERISYNGRHLLKLINGLLDLSKIESGKFEVEIQPTCLKSLVAETISQFEPHLEGRELRILADLPEGLDPVDTDPVRLQQILINLVGNALKFTDDGTITVVACCKDKKVEAIEIKDSGPGIHPETLKSIFDPFVQASSGHEGTGLGLAISRSLCQALNYELEADSELGIGSVFRIKMSKTPEPITIDFKSYSENQAALMQSISLGIPGESLDQGESQQAAD